MEVVVEMEVLAVLQPEDTGKLFILLVEKTLMAVLMAKMAAAAETEQRVLLVAMAVLVATAPLQALASKAVAQQLQLRARTPHV
jgi:hypothetical protein